MSNKEPEGEWFVQVMFDNEIYHVFHEKPCMYWVMEDIAKMIADEEPDFVEIRATRKKS